MKLRITILVSMLALQVTGVAVAEEVELSWDDGTPTNMMITSVMTPFATTFAAPADCQLTTYRIYWRSENGAGENVDVTCFLYADNSGEPTGDPVFSLLANTGSISDSTWFEVDVSGEGIMLSQDEVFHPAWSYSGAGDWDIMGSALDTPQGSGSCWTTDFMTGNWFNDDGLATHMMRVVVETNPTALNRSTWAAIKGIF